MDELGDIEPKACETIPSSEAGVKCCVCNSPIDGVSEITREAVDLLLAAGILKSRETARGTEFCISEEGLALNELMQSGTLPHDHGPETIKFMECPACRAEIKKHAANPVNSGYLQSKTKVELN